MNTKTIGFKTFKAIRKYCDDKNIKSKTIGYNKKQKWFIIQKK